MNQKISYSIGGDYAAPLNTNIWAIEEVNGLSRLVIAPESDHLHLMAELAELLPDPFGILYVLIISRCDNEIGRYQSPFPCTLEETKVFLERFREYLEFDGRHHLWMTSLPEKMTLVYDNHNIIYAYGPIEQYENILLRRGFKEEKVINMSVPHAHHYDPEYDESERAILSYWGWQRYPLQSNEKK